jgi:hypothetical protein
MLQRLLAKDASDTGLVHACVTHHRAYLVFRRSLRRLSVDDDDIRRARARARLNQIRQIRIWNPEQSDTTADHAVTLLEFERLADALAEGEFHDMGLDRKAAETALALLIRRFRAAS